MIWIVDANVIVTLCQRGALEALARGNPPFWVPEQVDDELTARPDKYPAQVQQYEAAKAQGLIVVMPVTPGSPEYSEYDRLRRKRGNVARNRGEDACVALALIHPGTLVCTGDANGLNRATMELGGAARVKNREELLALLGL